MFHFDNFMTLLVVRLCVDRWSEVWCLIVVLGSHLVLGTWYLVLAISKVTQSLHQGDQLPLGHNLLDVVQPQRLLGGDHLQGQAAQSDPA